MIAGKVDLLYTNAFRVSTWETTLVLGTNEASTKDACVNVLVSL